VLVATHRPFWFLRDLVPEALDYRDFAPGTAILYTWYKTAQQGAAASYSPSNGFLKIRQNLRDFLGKIRRHPI
jgi:hypothetical protein